MHVGFNCRLQCGLSGSGVRWGMRLGTASRQVVCMVVRLCAWLCTVRGVVAGSVQRVYSVGLLSAI